MTSCPIGSVTYNSTLCACPVGQLLNRTTDRCTPFTASSEIVTDIGLANTVSFFETIFNFDTIKKFTQSQAVFLEATLVILFLWLFFCCFLRFMKHNNDGKNIWFIIRWWISRLDVCFSTRHWLDDQQVVVKRKTELGGTFSMASWILFTGLFAALLYQIISKRSIEVNNVRATNALDLASFDNDMEFNITAVSSMSCSNVRGLGTLVTGNPGFMDHRVVKLSELVTYICQNTSTGPTLTFKCTNCRISKEYMYISWQFIDLPNAPASAVGYHFNLTTRNHVDKRHFSFVSGTLKNGSASDDRPVTFRGKDSNVLKFNLFPRVYHNLHHLRLIQPLFHEFTPGSFFRDTAQLQASLATSADGLINTTLYVHYLSSYVVEIENQNIMGPVSFLADLGGIYCVSICIFFYLLVQCEYRIKRLRNEDTTMLSIRNHRKAQTNWDKLRRYVRYRWGISTMDDDLNKSKHDSSCNCITGPSIRTNGSARRSGSSWSGKFRTRTDSIVLNKKASKPSEKNVVQGQTDTQGVELTVARYTLNTEGVNVDSAGEFSVKGGALGSAKDGIRQHSANLHDGASHSQAHSRTDDNIIPLPPPLDFKADSEADISDIQKNLQHMYNYNVILRENLLATQSLLNSIATKSSTSLSENQT
ncbi:uncharacterized protein LOC126674402 [Mercurialis annua]|uniref:uncharacterized protein LOC126674402 n=1 Tax=Mercurialis annua TaxID=3986 RepID=UPI00215F9AAA|nr:uncharacterized protein LOC126674402 [Mercurialis annua]